MKAGGISWVPPAALRDMGQERVNQYKVLKAAFPATTTPVARVGDKPSDQNAVHVPFQHQFQQVFAIFKGLGSAKPSDRFTIDLKGKKVSNANSAALSFNESGRLLAGLYSRGVLMLGLRAVLPLCFVWSAAWAVEPPPRADSGARVEALLPAIDRQYAALAAKDHLPALVYGIVVDGKLAHVRATGLANVEAKIPATRSTRFRIASMSKSFVAMAALKLRDDGKLRLDDPVALHLPEFATVALPTSDSPAVTVRMLLTMSSGLPEDNPWGDRQMALDQAAIARLLGAGLAFSRTPEAGFEYSNLGYIMLGQIVSKMAGMRFQDYITVHILKPLGMHDTVWEYAGVPAAQLALGYHWNGAGWEREPMLHDGDAAAMGGLLTTADDFARYVALHLSAWPARDGADSGPLRRASLREMHAPRAPIALAVDDGKPVADFYGYGLVARYSKGLHIVGHGGGLPGFGSDFAIAPMHGVGVFAFSNLRYAAVEDLTEPVLRELVDRGGLAAYPVAPSAILLTRKEQVARLVQGWDEALGRAIAADNLYLDEPREQRMRAARTQFDSIGRVLSVGPLRAANRLRGEFPIIGEKGRIKVFFTLTPEREPKVQELSLTLVADLAAQRLDPAAFGLAVQPAQLRATGRPGGLAH